MPRFVVTVREKRTYEIDAPTEDEARTAVAAAAVGQTTDIPTSVEQESIEIAPLAEPWTEPPPADVPEHTPRDPRDDPDDPLVRSPRIL